MFYSTGDAFVRVPVQTDPSFTDGEPQVLFEGTYRQAGGRDYEVGPDGRFLMVEPVGLSDELLVGTQINVAQPRNRELFRRRRVRRCNFGRRPVVPQVAVVARTPCVCSVYTIVAAPSLRTSGIAVWRGRGAEGRITPLPLADRSRSASAQNLDLAPGTEFDTYPRRAAKSAKY